MKKRILLPTDFSKNSLNAIRYAIDLFAGVPCEFYLLNAFQVPGYTLESMMVPEPGEPRFDDAKRDSDDGMLRLMEMIRLHGDNPRHSFQTLSVFNAVLTAIKAEVGRRDIDIIVMGTKGITGSSKAIFGTQTVNVMEKITQCPVLAVPDDFSFQPPKSILFPTDYKANFKRKEMSCLLEIAEMFASSLHILHIVKKVSLSKKQEEGMKLLMEILEPADYSLHMIEGKNVSKGITDFVTDNLCDMIAFLNKKHLFFGSILSNPLVKEIGYYPSVPVLVLNDNA
ncbi:universal stress protein [Poritiphilus flavus]|uniref:Universal stress protein n=1 Tax=Poritiphilus flavus TaxID=2697053 RepID=A0A6L9EB60_9FLAO|nr:universal stress protein [Poritiphilus flavus]NAS11930.1 universal stress protein [Poritiphilus flavus]